MDLRNAPAKHQKPRDIETPFGTARATYITSTTVDVGKGGAHVGVIVRLSNTKWTFDKSPYDYDRLEDAVLGMLRRARPCCRARSKPTVIPHPWPAGLFMRRK